MTADASPEAVRSAWVAQRRRSGRLGQLRRAAARARAGDVRQAVPRAFAAIAHPARPAPRTVRVDDLVLPVLTPEAIPPRRRDIAATVLDARAAASLRPEWEQLDLLSSTWRSQLAPRPALVLVQASAASLWPPEELAGLRAWCSRDAIPFLLWADEAVPESLAPDQVVVLGPWAQPRLHRPVLWGPGRVYALATDDPPPRELAPLLAGAAGLAPVHLVPDRHRLDAQASVAVHLHAGAPQRLVELAAAATPVLTVAEADAERILGRDLAQVATTPEQAHEVLADLLSDADARDRLGHRLHRRVLDTHTAGHRVEELLEAAGIASAASTPGVSVLLATNRPGQIDHALAQVAGQTWPSLQLVVALHGPIADPEQVAARARAAGVDDVVVVVGDATCSLGAVLDLALDAADGDVVAKVDDDNLYAPAYLTDLVRALDWSDAHVVGKWAHHVWVEGERRLLLRFAGSEHRFTDKVQGGTLLVRGDVARRLRFDDLPRGVDTAFLRRCDELGLRVYSADRWNFVSVRRADPSDHTWPATAEQLQAGDTVVVASGADLDPLAVVSV